MFIDSMQSDARLGPTDLNSDRSVRMILVLRVKARTLVQTRRLRESLAEYARSRFFPIPSMTLQMFFQMIAEGWAWSREGLLTFARFPAY